MVLLFMAQLEDLTRGAIVKGILPNNNEDLQAKLTQTDWDLNVERIQ